MPEFTLGRGSIWKIRKLNLSFVVFDFLILQDFVSVNCSVLEIKKKIVAGSESEDFYSCMSQNCIVF